MSTSWLHHAPRITITLCKCKLRQLVGGTFLDLAALIDVQYNIHLSNIVTSGVAGRVAGGAGAEGGGLHAGRRHGLDQPLQPQLQPGRAQDRAAR